LHQHRDRHRPALPAQAADVRGALDATTSTSYEPAGTVDDVVTTLPGRIHSPRIIPPADRHHENLRVADLARESTVLDTMPSGRVLGSCTATGLPTSRLRPITTARTRQTVPVF
jgi:hypothetical protein